MYIYIYMYIYNIYTYTYVHVDIFRCVIVYVFLTNDQFHVPHVHEITEHGAGQWPST